MTTTSSLKPLKTERQKALWNLLSRDFSELRRRDAQFYLLNGMSTSHITLHVMRGGDAAALAAFWTPPKSRAASTLQKDLPKSITDAQNAIRTTLSQLASRGYVDTLGNEQERRWRPSDSAISE
jgi:hypothetical protein